MGDQFKNRKPMGTHWVNYKYLFSNQMLSDKKHTAWKLVYFCIDSYKQLFNIEKGSRIIWGFLKNPQLECFEISLIFHGLLLWLQKKIEMKIFLNWSQECLKKIHGYRFTPKTTQWVLFECVCKKSLCACIRGKTVPIAMLCSFVIPDLNFHCSFSFK
jgi:hypothetical protein